MTSESYLTKSAYKLAASCHTKLHYLLLGYPKNTDENDYLELLAEGGYMVGALAKLRYPNGKEAPRTSDPAKDFAATREMLAAGDGVVFEGTLLAGRKLAVADIIERKGNVLRLIEVKSKSFDGAENGRNAAQIFWNTKGKISSEWQEYILDISYQAAVIAECLPEFRVVPYLLLVDKGKRVSLEGAPGYFRLHKEEGRRPVVQMPKGTAHLSAAADILTELEVTREVAEFFSAVREEIAVLEKVILDGKKPVPERSMKCRECEFRGEELSPAGYAECWKGMPEAEQHIFDLYQGTRLKIDGEFLFDRLIREKKTSIFDVPFEILKGKNGERQGVQIEYSKKNEEWLDPKLLNFLSELKYPLHFIDFETTRTAIPFHRGMRPFEQIAFQWSCHTVESRNAEPRHTEWINIEPKFPNFAFARALKETLSKDGTVLCWAAHEASVLTDIADQMQRYNEKDPELLEFIQLLVAGKGAQGRLVDMNRLTIDHYFHPQMKGRTSIKKVFPAIWRQNAKLRKLPWFAAYEKLENGEVLDPYEHLPPIIIDGSAQAVKEGTGAMRAYEELIFGDSSLDPQKKKQWERLLLQYCKLDTLAMVAIWEHWSSAR